MLGPVRDYDNWRTQALFTGWLANTNRAEKHQTATSRLLFSLSSTGDSPQSTGTWSPLGKYSLRCSITKRPKMIISVQKK